MAPTIEHHDGHSQTPANQGVNILELLRDFRGDSLIPETVGNIKQVQALINELNFDKLRFRRKLRYAGKEFIKRKGHNHFKF